MPKVRESAAPKGVGNRGKGRKPGVPNKATQAAREAIARFVDGNAHRLQEWLDQVAEGVQNEEGEYIVKPDPEKAYSLFQSVIEYHVPKLARTELTGKDGGAIIVQAKEADDSL